MKLQQLLSYTRKAVDDYQLIDDGDKIAVGISGGKDSLTLLYALHGLKRFYPRSFSLIGVTVDLGFPGFDLSEIRAPVSYTHLDVYKRQGYTPKQIEGYQSANWILMDYGDIVIHIFDEENRLFYDLERIWRDGQVIDSGELNR